MKLMKVAYLLIIILHVTTSFVFAQNNDYLQIDLSGGQTMAFRDFAKAPQYAGKGFNGSLSLDYFFGKFAIGVEGGYFRNNAPDIFTTFIKERYLETNPAIKTRPWESKYLLFGPAFKFVLGKLELDIYARAGMVQANAPEFVFSKIFTNQSFPIYTLSGERDKWYGAWSGGGRLIYKFSESFGLLIKGNVFSTEGINHLNHKHTFSDASDTNGNGKIDDSEYFESRVTEQDYKTYINNININAGIIVHLGKSSKGDVIKMMPDFLYEADTETTPDEIAVAAPDSAYYNEIPEMAQSVDTSLVTITPDEYVAAPDVTDYDELAAHFLYKAGQSYFAANDFENAVACFNKLKADPVYPMAKYMFSLSLAAMGNCETSFSEYREFAKKYTGEDAGVLATVYASHLERCKKPGLRTPTAELPVPHNVDEKPKSLNAQYEARAKEVSEKETKTVISTPESESKVNAIQSHSYRVQFIALKKPDYSFPKLYEIGEIITEFFPERSMYRYTLGPFTDADTAAVSMRKMRKMGFKDAFVAEYQDGKRINTLHYSR